MKTKLIHRVLFVGSLPFLLAIVAPVLTGCSEDSRPEGQRLVLITLDTLRYDSFAGSAEKSSAMPHLKRWAEGAAVFERFYAATAATQPSHASMFTGLQPWQHGVTGNRLRLGEHHVTIAERLHEAGFATAAVVASLPVSRRFGFAQGFDHFSDEFVAGEAPRGDGEEHPEEAFYSLADVITDRALARLDAGTGRRQFFWFHYFDPHSPYGDTADGSTIRPQEVLQLAKSGEETGEAVARAHRLYDVDVAFLDASLRRIFDRLDADAAELETHVVVTADHGESFGEDGSIAHGRRLISSQLHVPCLIRSPRLTAGPRRDIAGSIDIAATLLALAGLEEMPDRARPLRSRDLSRPQPGSRAFGMRRTWQKPHRDVRLDGTVHLLDDHLFFMVDEEGALHRGNSERLLALERSALPDEEAQNLRRLFAAFEKVLGKNAAESDDDPEIKEALRALGYAG